MWLVALIACTDDTTDTAAPVAEVPIDDLNLVVQDPARSNPFSGLDDLQLRLLNESEAVVLDVTWDADEDPEIDSIDLYGTFRMTLAGLDNGDVVAFGRTAWFSLVAGHTTELTMLFTTINTAVPLESSMARERSDHVAERLPGGKVLICGGRSPDGGTAYDDCEVYDPSDFDFDSAQVGLPRAVFGAKSQWSGDGDLLFITGGTEIDGPLGETATAIGAIYDPVEEQLDELPLMNSPRTGHCFSIFREEYGIAIGNGEAKLDYLIHQQDGSYEWTYVSMIDLDAENVYSCVTTTDRKVVMLGSTAGATGVFDYADDAQSTLITEAYTPITQALAGDYTYRSGAMLVPMASGNVWIGGGLDTTLQAPVKEGRVFNPDSLVFGSGPDTDVNRVDGDADPWIDEDWVALSCGTIDGTDPQTRVELLHVGDGDLIAVELDRPRPGCRGTVLDDGAILVTGGFDSEDSTTAAAAVIVPYRASDDS